MSKLRVNEITDLNDNLLWEASQGVGGATVLTSTGEQTLAEALDGRVVEGEIGAEQVTAFETSDTRDLANWMLSVKGAARSVSNHSELKAYSGLAEALFLEGRESAGDRGEALVQLLTGDQSALVTQDPSEVVYIPAFGDATGASGVWKKVFTESINVFWAGAKCDKTTNDAAAIRAAAKMAIAEGVKLFVPEVAESYYSVKNLDLSDCSGLTIEGASYPKYDAYDAVDVEGQSAFVEPAGVSGHFIRMPGNFSYITFRNMVFFGATRVSSYLFEPSVARNTHLEAVSCGFYNFFEAISNVGVSKFFSNVYCSNGRGIADTIDCEYVGGYVVSCTVGVLLNGSSDNTFNGMKIEYNDRNLSCTWAVHNVFSGCVIDAAVFQNIRLSYSAIAISGSTVRRAGYDAGETSSHVYMQGDSTYMSSGVAYYTGDYVDGGGGGNGPDYLIAFESSSGAQATFVGGFAGFNVAAIYNEGTNNVRFSAVLGLTDQ